ncbi:hypothetical protein BP6252_05618 [Coleophoma cylindrospora]|uniref:Uncharacterized protein n=1 Tax=Coleophoma cylindrospora TaxID=1849047 RepID=A0A3D8RU86_9HELO|nr:hypothetical protein BP6252_05618 [Coleophoma cylindrospora]
MRKSKYDLIEEMAKFIATKKLDSHNSSDTKRSHRPDVQRTAREESPASSRTCGRHSEASNENLTPDSACSDKGDVPGTLRYLSEHDISIKLPDGTSIFYEKLNNIGGFLVFDDAKGLQVWQRADTKVATKPVVVVKDHGSEAEHLLPPTIRKAKQQCFANLPLEVKRVLDHPDCPDDLSLKQVSTLTNYRHQIEKIRRKKWRRYIVAAKAMQKISLVRTKLRHQYDDELEAYRKKVQQKIRKSTLMRMKDLIAITAKVEKFEDVLQKCFKVEWSEFAKDL